MLKANLRNLVYQSAAQIIPRAILFVFTFYLARILGSNEYGKYDFALSIGYLLGVFYELGGNVILTKYTARGYYSSFSFSLKFRIICIVLTSLTAFAIFFITGIYHDVIIQISFAALGIAFSSLMNLYFAFFRGVRQMNYEAWVLIVQKLVFIGICIVFILNKINSVLALAAFTASMFIAWLMIQFIYVRRRHRYVESQPFDSPAEAGQAAQGDRERVRTKQYLKDIFTLALAEIFGILYFRVTQVILEAYSGFHEVGVYGVSFKVVEALGNVASILMIVLFPSFAKLATENLKEFRVQFRKVFILLAGGGIISSAVCWVGGKFLFTLIGKDYGEAYVVLRYMTIALTFIFPNYLLTQGLIALDKNIQYASIVFSVAVLNIVVSILLVPIYGAIGSAISVGLCEAVIFVLTLAAIRTQFRKVLHEKT